MKISRNCGDEISIFIDRIKLEQVKKYKYLGSWLTEDGRTETEIKVRISMAKEAFCKRKELLTRGLNKKVKKKIVKTMIWPVALYGAETWTLKKDDKRRLNALEMWIWRKLEKITWMDHKTNEIGRAHV